MSAEHLVPLGDTGWHVWRDALLRSTGFPFDGLARFAAPDCARSADALLAGDVAGQAFDEQFERAVAEGAAACADIAADPRFREAVSWQSLTALSALDGLLRTGEQRRNRKRVERERLVARYWQRYCAKNDTIGFFGPSAWATVDPLAPAISVRVGAGLTRTRVVDFEHWALAAFSRRLAEDPATRRWLPPAPQPHFTLDAGRVLRPAAAPMPVSAAEADALSRCDGRIPATTIIAGLVADGVVRTDADGHLLLERLAERELLSWHGDLPQTLDAEPTLRALLHGIGDPAIRAATTAKLDTLCAARDRVAAAAGDPDRLAEALSALAAEFTAGTGLPAYRRSGETYAGRALCFEETARDIDLVVGGRLLAELAEPLALLLGAARWLTAELAHAYGTALRELYDDLAADGAEVRFSDLWYFAQGPLFGSGERPVDEVAREFARRWAKLFGLDGVPPDRALRFTSAELATAAAAFPAERPGWSTGRLHSPDLLICAEDAAAVERGDYFVVLGELHTTWPTFDSSVFTRWHPDVAALRRALAADLGEHRVHLLYPVDWRGYSGRVARTLDGPTDRELGFTAAPGADLDRLLPTTSVVVIPDAAGELVAQAPDGRRWPLLEMFADLLAIHAVDGFKLVDGARHTPRITVDKLVVARETWRTTVEETGLTNVIGERARYLAVRRWRQELGLPDRVFVRLDAEIKPVYVDLTSPTYAVSLCAMVRSAKRAGGTGAVTITEVLPDAGQHWLRDAQGRPYSSELRLQVIDPMAAR